MEVRDTHRLGARMLAINIRLAELDHELQRTQVRVHHLEAQLEDARLARMVGEDAGNPEEIVPELEQSRDKLENQRSFISGVRANLRQARADYMMARVAERREERRLEAERAAEDDPVE